MTEMKMLTMISRYIDNSQNTTFSGTWALLVDWSNVHPFNHQTFVDSPFRFQELTARFLNSISV